MKVWGLIHSACVQGLGSESSVIRRAGRLGDGLRRFTQNLSNLTFRGPCIVIYSYNDSQDSAPPYRRSMKGATINGVTYEGVTEFVYLGTIISNDNSVQKEIQRCILAGNRTYFAAISLSGTGFYPELLKLYYIRH